MQKDFGKPSRVSHAPAGTVLLGKFETSEKRRPGPSRTARTLLRALHRGVLLLRGTRPALPLGETLDRGATDDLLHLELRLLALGVVLRGRHKDTGQPRDGTADAVTRLSRRLTVGVASSGDLALADVAPTGATELALLLTGPLVVLGPANLQFGVGVVLLVEHLNFTP